MSMQYISIYDMNGVIANRIKEMGFWEKRQDLILNENILADNRSLINDLQKIKPNVLIMVADNTEICSYEGIRQLKKKLTGMNIIFVGYDNSYETVRRYFHSGVLDYLVLPVEEEGMLESVLRIYMEFGLDYILNDLQLKVDALIENIFLGGGQEEYIIENIIEQIYTDWKNDPLNCQIISDKTKYHIYEMLIERKPWLEKFLYRNDFSYHLGFSVKTKKEIIQNWLECFLEASAMVTKYQMIDDKLVYHIGK